ncbi:MAG: ABC transporter ATP-binding protein [candidate division Zixibacteria bacterium]|nr:ABC transporter ATP-binding protein [candidate division Zixibacteria bacterium]
MIEIIHLKKSFGKPVLVDVNLTIEHGETMVIIGRSGCGKSVLLKHIIGLIHPDEGTLLVDGQDVTRLKGNALDTLRKRFGMLFQAAALFDSMTVGENVGLGLSIHSGKSPEEIEEQVRRCLKMVGLSGIEALKPAELSGGMRKRVGLARAIAMNPEYILYDEPTTGLDPIMADIINHLILHMKNELAVTSIAVTHDMVSAYKIADRIAMLHDGKIHIVGTPEEIRSSDDPLVQQFILGKSEGPIKTLE